MYCKPTSMHIYSLVQVHKLTTSQPVVSRELESTFRAVPAFPSKLELTLFNAILGTLGHTGSVGQISLAKGKGLWASAPAQTRSSGEQAELKWVSSPWRNNHGFFWVRDSGTISPPLFSFPKKDPLGSWMGKNRSQRASYLGTCYQEIVHWPSRERKSEALVNRAELMGLPWQGVRVGGKDLPGRGTESGIAYAHSHPQHKQDSHGPAHL